MDYTQSAGDSAFGLRFLSRLGKGNASISPYNMRSALAMLYEGATNKTAQEIADVTGFPQNIAVHRRYQRDIADAFATVQGCTLRTANGLWLAENYAVKAGFTKAMAEEYKAQIKNVDFLNAAETCRKSINNWVSDATEKKITELFSEGSIDAETKIVLASAMYFKGQWASKFLQEHTRQQNFSRADGTTIPVDMMRKGSIEGKMPEFCYSDRYGQTVALPYAGNEVTKIVWLPPKNETVDTLIEVLQKDGVGFGSMLTRMFPEDFARLELPRHELRGGYDLATFLGSMGLSRMFTEHAQFENITDADRLYISSGVHKTYFKTDEEGSEGAAATGFAALGGGILEPKEFVADRPFLEAIVHNASGSVLFLNRVDDPTKQ